MYIKALWLGLSMTISAPVIAQQTAIIFDLGGVLFGQSKAGFIRGLGLGSLISYSVLDRQAPWKFASHLQDLIFVVCERMTYDHDPLLIATCTTGGIKLPHILCAYQAGRITSKEVLTQLPGVLEQCRKDALFTSHRQEILVKRAIEGIFNAELIAKYIYPIKHSIELLKELSLMKHPDGTKKYRIIALSNWDRESFAHIKKRFARQFSYFDELVISSHINTIKPNPAAFEFVMSTFGLQPAQCVFIDDQSENIAAAKAFGIGHPIQFTSAHQVRKELMGLDIFPKPQRFRAKLSRS